jgi:hypothetical protein
LGALPDQNDPADQVPLKSDFTDNQALAKVDVFLFILLFIRKNLKDHLIGMPM